MKEPPEDWLPFSQDLQNLRHRAAEMGMYLTMHAITKAIQQSGYELAEKLETGLSKRTKP